MFRVKKISSEEVAHLLSKLVFEVLCGRINPKFPRACKGKPSDYVLLGTQKVDYDQYHQCVLPILEQEDLQILRQPRSREFLKDKTRTTYFVERIGGYLEKSFSSKGY